MFQSCVLGRTSKMIRARLIAFREGLHKKGEVSLCHEDQEMLEHMIKFYKWQIEFAGYWCYVERFPENC